MVLDLLKKITAGRLGALQVVAELSHANLDGVDEVVVRFGQLFEAAHDPEMVGDPIRRQTTPGPGGLIDKGTKGKRARVVPLIEEVREMVGRRLKVARDQDSRLFTGPRGGRISTAVLRGATQWDEVVQALGYEHLRRHDLRHAGLTWMADAGVPLHVLRCRRGAQYASHSPEVPKWSPQGSVMIV